jgi:hypothetical protein
MVGLIPDASNDELDQARRLTFRSVDERLASCGVVAECRFG